MLPIAIPLIQDSAVPRLGSSPPACPSLQTPEGGSPRAAKRCPHWPVASERPPSPRTTPRFDDALDVCIVHCLPLLSLCRHQKEARKAMVHSRAHFPRAMGLDWAVMLMLMLRSNVQGGCMRGWGGGGRELVKCQCQCRWWSSLFPNAMDAGCQGKCDTRQWNWSRCRRRREQPWMMEPRTR